LKQNIVDFQAAIENNERFAELLEKGPANLDADEKKRTRNYAQGDVIRFEKDYKSLGFKKGECAEIARVDYEYNTVYLRTGSGREVEWHPFKHARVELFKEHELPEKRKPGPSSGNGPRRSPDRSRNWPSHWTECPIRRIRHCLQSRMLWR
jgi:hypothetical protein